MPDPEAVSSAIAAWERELGRDAIISGMDDLTNYTRSVCASKREVVAVLKPSSTEQVQRVVSVANEFKVPLYPISTGKQWGMGSKLPVRDGAAIVDLSRMKRILEINERHHYAVVEPGVTQRQLIEHIKENELSLMLNVTGSAADTSLIGNAIDRGVGYFQPRAEGFSNLTVVLGNGETVKTGFGHIAGAKTQTLYPYGIGPDITGVFSQGNFGIVTSACIDLMPEPECHMAAIAKIDSNEKLPLLIDALVSLRSRGIFLTIAHIGNSERSFSTLAPLLYEQLVASGEPPDEATRRQAVQMLENGGFGPWSAAIGILGTKQQLKVAKKEIRKAVSGFAKTMFLNESLLVRAKLLCSALSFFPVMKKQLMMLNAVEPVYGFTRGDTTDQSLKSTYWSAGDYENLDADNPDSSFAGLMCCLPIIPAEGEIVSWMANDIQETFARYGFVAAITVNLMSAKAMEGVVSLSFDRRDQAKAIQALECIREMEQRFVELGYPPYRVGINSMDIIVNEDDSFWRTIRDLKQAFDPNHIISPGRFNLI